MKLVFLIILFLTIALLLLSACGGGTPEQQARTQYEHEQRFDAEMERLEREGLPREENESGSGRFFVEFSAVVFLFICGGITGWIIRGYEE